MTNDSSKCGFFVVILRYKVSLEKIDALRPLHLEFLQNCYDNGLFIVSGTQVPRTGGVIIAKSPDKTALNKLLAQDPFAINDLATYEVIEFTPTKWSKAFENILV